MGYANRTVRIDFSEELADKGDSIWVVIRNPKLMTQDGLRPREVETDQNGNPVNPDDALQAMCETFAKLIIGCRVYDATDLGVDEDGNEIGGDVLLPTQPPPAWVAKFPACILKRLTDEITEALNPH